MKQENKLDYNPHLSFDELLSQKTEEGWNYVGIESLNTAPPNIEDFKIRYSQDDKKEVEIVPYQEDSCLIFTKAKK